MTRRTAREIAMHLSFATVMNRMDIREMLDAFFEPDYFATLKTEDEAYADYPDDRQLAYIRRLAEGDGCSVMFPARIRSAAHLFQPCSEAISAQSAAAPLQYTVTAQPLCRKQTFPLSETAAVTSSCVRSHSSF